MPRKPRHAPGGFVYHVRNRGVGRGITGHGYRKCWARSGRGGVKSRFDSIRKLGGFGAAPWPRVSTTRLMRQRGSVESGSGGPLGLCVFADVYVVLRHTATESVGSVRAGAVGLAIRQHSTVGGIWGGPMATGFHPRGSCSQRGSVESGSSGRRGEEDGISIRIRSRIKSRILDLFFQVEWHGFFCLAGWGVVCGGCGGGENCGGGGDAGVYLFAGHLGGALSADCGGVCGAAAFDLLLAEICAPRIFMSPGRCWRKVRGWM